MMVSSATPVDASRSFQTQYLLNKEGVGPVIQVPGISENQYEWQEFFSLANLKFSNPTRSFLFSYMYSNASLGHTVYVSVQGENAIIYDAQLPMPHCESVALNTVWKTLYKRVSDFFETSPQEDKALPYLTQVIFYSKEKPCTSKKPRLG